MAASYTKIPVLESLFDSEYCEIFQSTYFEEHLQTAASENVFIFIKRINFALKKPILSTSISETIKNACFYFMIGFPWSFNWFTYNISLAWWEANKPISQWEFDYGLFANLPKIIHPSTQKRYPISPDKIRILTWKLLFISN